MKTMDKNLKDLLLSVWSVAKSDLIWNTLTEQEKMEQLGSMMEDRCSETSKSITSMIRTYLEYGKYRKHLDKKTEKAYRTDLSQYVEFTDQKDPYDRYVLDDYLTYLHKTAKPKTVKRKIASLKAFFSWLVKNEHIESNPFDKLDIRFQEEKELPKTLSIQEIADMLSVLYKERDKAVTVYKDRQALRNIALMELMFAAGMRVSELCSLRPEDLDLQVKTVRIHGKGKKERIIAIENSDTLAALQAYRNIRTACGQTFFCTAKGQSLSDQSIRRMVAGTAAKAGIVHPVTPHMFRHSFATLLMDQGVDTRYIQQMLGHSSISTTEIYTHVSSYRQREILRTMHPRNQIAVVRVKKP